MKARDFTFSHLRARPCHQHTFPCNFFSPNSFLLSSTGLVLLSSCWCCVELARDSERADAARRCARLDVSRLQRRQRAAQPTTGARRHCSEGETQINTAAVRERGESVVEGMRDGVAPPHGVRGICRLGLRQFNCSTGSLICRVSHVIDHAHAFPLCTTLAPSSLSAGHELGGQPQPRFPGPVQCGCPGAVPLPVRGRPVAGAGTARCRRVVVQPAHRDPGPARQGEQSSMDDMEEMAP